MHVLNILNGDSGENVHEDGREKPVVIWDDHHVKRN